MRLNPACPGVLFALVCLVALLRSQLVVSFHISATDWGGFEEAVPCPDYDLLMQLFNATNGPSWLRNSGWGTRGPCCDGSWDGVAQCDQSNHVLFLNLNANGMTGSIPESMPSFPQLNTLWMNLNQISGPFPSLLLSNPLLTNIDLSWNHMEGVIPWQSFSRGIQYFDVSGNQLSGTIPDDLFSQKMPLLVSFGLSSTQISGPIPSSLPTAPFLEDFTVENTLLSGTIPIATLTDHSAPYRRLETLYARSNRLSGTIPALLLNRPNLKYLYLSHNSLTDSMLGIIISNKVFSVFISFINKYVKRIKNNVLFIFSYFYYATLATAYRLLWFCTSALIGCLNVLSSIFYFIGCWSDILITCLLCSLSYVHCLISLIPSHW